MKIISARYANSEGGIVLEREGQPDLYVSAGDIYLRAKSGEFGEVGDYKINQQEGAEVPQSVTRLQARIALLNADLLDSAEAAILESDTKTRLAWSDAAVFVRKSPTVSMIAELLELSEEEVDDLFRDAALVEV